jgi:hypothetical protein
MLRAAMASKLARMRGWLVAGAAALFLLLVAGPLRVRTAEKRLAGFAAREPQSDASRVVGVYSNDPSDIENRLFRMFYVRRGRDGREYGGDVLDPYLWLETKYLLTGASRKEALQLLDEFLERHRERQITEPLKRALLQRDLLAVYEWLSFPGEKKQAPELQKRVGEIIRRLALSEEQVQKLPDNYDAAIRAHRFATNYDAGNPQQAFLPADLFDPKGPWVCLGEERGRPVASDHLQSFHGRSTFLVFFQVPGGREKTLEYLAKLLDVPTGWGPNPDLPGFVTNEAGPGGLVPYPEPPQFPIGTKVALVRQIVLMGTGGNPMPTNLTESVQIRVYRAIHFDLGGTGTHSQDFFEFRLSREELMRGEAGGLRAMSAEDKEFRTFHSHEMDIFERNEADPATSQGNVLSCSGCHEFAGIHSFLSYSRARFGSGEGLPPKLAASDAAEETAVQIRWIQGHVKRVGGK